MEDFISWSIASCKPFAQASGQTFVAKCISLAALNDQDQELRAAMALLMCSQDGIEAIGIGIQRF